MAANATVSKSIPVPGHNFVFHVVPVGKYALRRLETVNGKVVECEWHFFEVTRPKSGKWAGWTFLYEISGDNRKVVNSRENPQMFNGVLSSIARDPGHFSRQFGKRTGVCGVCSKTLTDPKSVKAGIGPVCAGRIGKD